MNVTTQDAPGKTKEPGDRMGLFLPGLSSEADVRMWLRALAVGGRSMRRKDQMGQPKTTNLGRFESAKDLKNLT